ncbi:MAG: sensor histidine kinase [Microbacter sp.]
MRFLTKINRNFFLLFTFTLLIISVAGYFILNAMFLETAREGLARQSVMIQNEIEKTGKIPLYDPLTQITPIQPPIGKLKSSIHKINLPDKTEHEMEPYAEYNRQVSINGNFYNIRLLQKMIESDDLAASIGVALFLLLLLSFAVSYFVNKRMNQTIWAKFEENLHLIEHYHFQAKEPFLLKPTHIDEFDRLNTIVLAMTQKLHDDYQALKEFTENASHELQTPLSIALFNLDELIQQPLSEEAFQKTITAINALKRLSHLNQSLLLLAKIENNQFVQKEKMNGREILEQKLVELKPLIEFKKIEVQWEQHDDWFLMIHPFLADILINNLLTNAMNHNIPKGVMVISTTSTTCQLCNSGQEEPLDATKIFNRFEKGNPQSHGLGLAIVKKICDTHQLTIDYTFTGKHCFTLSMPIEKLQTNP